MGIWKEWGGRGGDVAQRPGPRSWPGPPEHEGGPSSGGFSVQVRRCHAVLCTTIDRETASRTVASTKHALADAQCYGGSRLTQHSVVRRARHARSGVVACCMLCVWTWRGCLLCGRVICVVRCAVRPAWSVLHVVHAMSPAAAAAARSGSACFAASSSACAAASFSAFSSASSRCASAAAAAA